GFLKVIAVGEQSAFDTEVSTYSNFLIFNDESLVQTKTPLEPDEVHGEAGREVSEEGRITVGGDIGVNLRPEGGAWLLMKHAFGSLASSQPDSSGAPSVYQHDFTLAKELPINGLSVKVDRDISVFSYLGMKVQSVGFSYAMDAPALVTTFTLVGRNEEMGGSVPSPVYTTQVFWKDYQGVFLMDGVEQRISAFDLTIANSMREDDFRSGSQYRNQIERAGQRDISGTFSRRYIDNVLYNKFLNWERAILRFTFTSDAIEGGFSYQLVIDI
ncbi:unnamed protein product, partial [marine sediment metagenome]